jgi:hypothetical protein
LTDVAASLLVQHGADPSDLSLYRAEMQGMVASMRSIESHPAETLDKLDADVDAMLDAFATEIQPAVARAAPDSLGMGHCVVLFGFVSYLQSPKRRRSASLSQPAQHQRRSHWALQATLYH